MGRRWGEQLEGSEEEKEFQATDTGCERQVETFGLHPLHTLSRDLASAKGHMFCSVKKFPIKALHLNSVSYLRSPSEGLLSARSPFSNYLACCWSAQSCHSLFRIRSLVLWAHPPTLLLLDIWHVADASTTVERCLETAGSACGEEAPRVCAPAARLGGCEGANVRQERHSARSSGGGGPS